MLSRFRALWLDSLWFCVHVGIPVNTDRTFLRSADLIFLTSLNDQFEWAVPRCSKPSRDARMRAPRAVSSLDRFCAPYREGVSGRRASRIFDLPPAGRTKGWVMLTFGCHDAWVGGHGDEALRQLGWMAAWDASLLEPGQHVGATCSWHLQSG